MVLFPCSCDDKHWWTSQELHIDSHLLILIKPSQPTTAKTVRDVGFFLPTRHWVPRDFTPMQLSTKWNHRILGCAVIFLLENIHAHWLFMRYICPWFSTCFLLLGSAAKLLAESTHGSFNLTAYLGEWNYISCELEDIFKKVSKICVNTSIYVYV